MKTFLKLALAAVICSQASMAQSIAVNIIDKQTGSRFIQTSNQKGKDINIDDSVAKVGAVFFAAGYQGTADDKGVQSYFIDLNVIHNDNRNGCLSDGVSKAILIFSDESQMECMQISETDCGLTAFKGVFALMPKGGAKTDMQANFEKLQNTEIEKIVIVTTEKELTYKVKKESKAYIKKHFALLASTIKTQAK
jgi:hypothetical protein